jgi:phage gp29-like protein
MLEVINNPLYQKMAHRLLRAIASEDIRRKMDLEDDIERDYQDITTKFNKAKKELAEKDEKLAENQEKLAENEQKLAEQECVIAELLKKINS